MVPPLLSELSKIVVVVPLLFSTGLAVGVASREVSSSTLEVTVDEVFSSASPLLVRVVLPTILDQVLLASSTTLVLSSFLMVEVGFSFSDDEIVRETVDSSSETRE